MGLIFSTKPVRDGRFFVFLICFLFFYIVYDKDNHKMEKQVKQVFLSPMIYVGRKVNLMANISINEFAVLVANKINLDHPELEAKVKEITKNNDTKFTGITVSNDSNIAPVIYLDDLYSYYTMGSITVSDAVETVMKTYEKSQINSVDMSDFLNFEKIRDSIVYKLINKTKNEKLLEDVPHVDMLDLAIIFCVLCPSISENGMASVTIHNNHMQMWNIDVNELYEAAKKNTPKLLPARLTSMEEMLFGMKENLGMSNEDFEELPETDIPMYVLTNSVKTSGAACILYENTLKSFAEKIDGDVVILPSSIHETILIPASLKDNMTDLIAMVREVNATQVSPDEVLSDNVYVYNRGINEIQKADDEELAV